MNAHNMRLGYSLTTRHVFAVTVEFMPLSSVTNKLYHLWTMVNLHLNKATVVRTHSKIAIDVQLAFQTVKGTDNNQPPAIALCKEAVAEVL